MASKETKKQRRTAAQVANSQNVLTLRKILQEIREDGTPVIPDQRVKELIDEYLRFATGNKAE